MKANTKDMEFIKRELDTIIAYEKTLVKPFLSASRILKYFGEESICAVYGCTVVSPTIAQDILLEVLKINK